MIKELRKKYPVIYRETVIIAKVLSPFVIILALALYFNEFVMRAIESDLAISGLIICTSIYCIIIILQRLSNAKTDFRIIERFGKEASEGASMNKLLEEPWIRESYVRHYLKHIAETGGVLNSQLDQSAIENELHAFQADYDSKLEFPQFLTGFMIAMGLLGTFIGLLETLTGISGMLAGMASGTASPEEQFKQLVGELRKPLAGMGIAFSASMFGLITSLMLSIMMTNLRHFISRLVMCARNVMHDLTEIAHKTQASSIHSNTIQTNVTQLDQYNQANNQNINTNRTGSNGDILLASRMDLLLKKLEVLFKSFENSINGTTKLNDLLGFGPRMKETAENTLEEIRNVNKSNIEQQRIMQQFLDSQNSLVNIINSIMETQRRTQVETTTAFRAISERILAVEQVSIGSGKHLWEIKEAFANMETLKNTFEIMSSSINHQTILFEDFVMEIRGIRDTLRNNN